MLFSITVEEKPECAKELSGLMCMAISGGAILPLLMGWFIDLGWKEFAFIVPAISFVYLLLLSLKGNRKPVTAAEKQTAIDGLRFTINDWRELYESRK